MSYINVDKIVDALIDPLRHCLCDKDPYVRKTAAISVSKLYMYDKALVESEGFIDLLRNLLLDGNPTVRILPILLAYSSLCYLYMILFTHHFFLIK